MGSGFRGVTAGLRRDDTNGGRKLIVRWAAGNSFVGLRFTCRIKCTVANSAGHGSGIDTHSSGCRVSVRDCGGAAGFATGSAVRLHRAERPAVHAACQINSKCLNALRMPSSSTVSVTYAAARLADSTALPIAMPYGTWASILTSLPPSPNAIVSSSGMP